MQSKDFKFKGKSLIYSNLDQGVITLLLFLTLPTYDYKSNIAVWPLDT